MIDLTLLSRLIDEALAKETTESIDAFLAAHPDAPAQEEEPAFAGEFEGFMGAAQKAPMALEQWQGSVVSASQGTVVETKQPVTSPRNSGAYSYAMAA